MFLEIIKFASEISIFFLGFLLMICFWLSVYKFFKSYLGKDKHDDD